MLICSTEEEKSMMFKIKFLSKLQLQATQICFASVPFKVNEISRFLAVLRKSYSSNRWMTTETSADEEEVKEKVFNQLISAVESDPASSKQTCAAYIEKMCRSGDLLNGARLLRSLHDKHIFLSSETYNILLIAACERKDVEILCQIFKDMLLSCNFLGKHFYSHFAKAFSNVNDCVPLLKFVREVSEVMFPKSTNIMNRIIFSFGESGQMDKALKIFNLMQNLKCKPDVVTYNTVLDILGQAKKVDEMLHGFASMKESRIAPDIITYNTVINNLRKMGRLDLCLVVLREMGENGLNPDLLTYTALIDSFGRSGRVDEALGLFGEMKRRGIPPSIYIYRALIGNLKKVGKLELAVSLIEEMNSCV